MYIDINECPGACPQAHICRNTIGHYTCLCNDGYRLEDNQICIGESLWLLLLQKHFRGCYFAWCMIAECLQEPSILWKILVVFSVVLQLLSLNLQVADSGHAHSIAVYFLCSHVLHGSLSASLVETAVSTPQLCFTVHADILCLFC